MMQILFFYELMRDEVGYYIDTILNYIIIEKL